MRKTWLAAFLPLFFSTSSQCVEREYYFTPSLKLGMWGVETQNDELDERRNITNLKASAAPGVSLRNFAFDGEHHFLRREDHSYEKSDFFSEYGYNFRLGNDRDWPILFGAAIYEKQVYNTGVTNPLLERIFVNDDAEMETGRKFSLSRQREMLGGESNFYLSRNFVDSEIEGKSAYSFLDDEARFSLSNFRGGRFYYRLSSSYLSQTNRLNTQGYSFLDSSLTFYTPLYQRIFFSPAVEFSNYHLKNSNSDGVKVFYFAPGFTVFGSNGLDYVTVLRGRDPKTGKYHSSYYGSMKRDELTFDLSWAERARGVQRSFEMSYKPNYYGFSLFSRQNTSLRLFSNVFQEFKGMAVCEQELESYDPAFCELYGDDVLLLPEHYLVPYFERVSTVVSDVFYNDVFGGSLFGELSRFSFKVTAFNKKSKSSNSSLSEDWDYFKLFVKWNISDVSHVSLDSEIRAGRLNDDKQPYMRIHSLSFKRNPNSFSSWGVSLNNASYPRFSGERVEEIRIGVFYEISF